MRLAKLPSANNYRKFAPVPAKSGSGIGLPSTSAKALIRSAFFVPAIYGGLLRGASARRSRTGKTNSVQPATLLIGLNGGGFFGKYEVVTMENPTLNPSGLTETKALYEAIRDVNGLAQEGFLQVAALASLVALRLESGIQYAWQQEELRYALEVIRSRSLDARSCILCIAQDSGCFNDAEVSA